MIGGTARTWLLIALTLSMMLPSAPAAGPDEEPHAVLDITEGPVGGAYLFDLTSSVPASGIANFLTNPSFEDNFEGWTLRGTRADARIDFDETAFEGRRSLRIHIPSGPAGYVEITQTFALAIEERLDIRARVRDDSGAGGVRLRLEGGASADLNVTARGPYWQTLWSPATGSGNVTLVLRVEAAPGRAATAWFDDILAREGLTYDWRLDGAPFATPAPVFATRFATAGQHRVTGYAVDQAGRMNQTFARFNVTADAIRPAPASIDIVGPDVVFVGDVGTWTAGNTRGLTPERLINPQFSFGLDGWALDVTEAPRFLVASDTSGHARLTFGRSDETRTIMLMQVVPIERNQTYDVTARYRTEGDVLGLAFILREVGFEQGRYVATGFRDRAWNEPPSGDWSSTRFRWTPTYPDSTHVYILLRALVRGDAGVVEFDDASFAPAPKFVWQPRAQATPDGRLVTSLPLGVTEIRLSAEGRNETGTKRVLALDRDASAAITATANGTVTAHGRLPSQAAGMKITVSWEGAENDRRSATVDSDGNWSIDSGPRWDRGAIEVNVTLDAAAPFLLKTRELSGSVDDIILKLTVEEPLARLTERKVVITLDDDAIREGTLTLTKFGVPALTTHLVWENGSLVGTIAPGFLTRPGSYDARLTLSGPEGATTYALPQQVRIRVSENSEEAVPWLAILFGAAFLAALVRAVQGRREDA